MHQRLLTDARDTEGEGPSVLPLYLSLGLVLFLILNFRGVPFLGLGSRVASLAFLHAIR